MKFLTIIFTNTFTNTFTIVFTIVSFLICTVNPALFAANFALQFDGQNDFIDCGEAEVLHQVEDITIECWFKSNSNSRGIIVTNRHEDDGSDFPTLMMNNNHAVISCDDRLYRQDIESETAINDNRWHHIAGTKEGATWIIYVDGEAESSVDDDHELSGSEHNLHLGHHGAWNDYRLAAIIDEIRIWNYARTEEQIQAAMNVMVTGREEGLIGYWRFDEGEGQFTSDLTGNGHDGRFGANENADEQDPRWIESDAPVYGGMLEMSCECLDFGPAIHGRDNLITLNLTNTSAEDDDWHAVEFTFSEVGEAPDWIDIEPSEGVVPVNENVEIIFTANIDEIEAGEYERTIILECNASNFQLLEMQAHIIVVDGAGLVHGRVTDAETGEPVTEAIVSVLADFPMYCQTDEDGQYEFSDMPAYNYILLVTAEDYMAMVSDQFEVEDGDEIEMNFELLHSEFIPEPRRVEASMQTDEFLEMGITAQNPGNAPLTWNVERVFPDEMQIEPLTHRWQCPAEEIVDNTRMGGVEFVGDYFYVAGGVRDGDNQIYKLNRDGELVSQFPQFAESNYGFRDLAWDGELLWGVDEGFVYGFTTDGELITRFESPTDPARGIVWIPDMDRLVICNTTTELFVIDREGNLQEAWERPGDNLHVYGMGWYPEDIDGFPLYLFCGDGENRREFHKLNPVTGEARFIFEPEIEGQSGAMTVNGLWDPYCWVLIGLTRANPDAIEIWQLGSRTEWLAIAPTEGVIEDHNNANLTITLNTAGLPEEQEFSADLVFTHDGVGAETIVPVLLQITGEGGVSQRHLHFDLGWNMISLNITPVEDDLETILQPLVEAGLLSMIKDSQGRFFNPAFHFINIPFWNSAEGYQVKVEAECGLNVAGEVIAGDTPIELTEGWQIISYYPRQPVNAAIAFSGIEENLLIAKNNDGRFYAPEFHFNGIGDLMEGQGYQVKLDADVQLVYSQDGNRIARAEKYSNEELTWLSAVTKTGTSFSLLVLAEGNLTPGTKLQSFNSLGELCGRGIVGSDGMAGLALWGDDPTTERIEGFRNGERLVVVDDDELSLEWLAADARTWTADGWGVVRVMPPDLPVEFGLTSVYPNPFNGQLKIDFACVETGYTTLRVYDLNGRLLDDLLKGERSAGTHSLVWEAQDQPSGVYLIQISQNSQTAMVKVVLIR